MAAQKVRHEHLFYAASKGLWGGTRKPKRERAGLLTVFDGPTMALMIERGTFLVPTTYLADGMDVSSAAPELQAKAAEVFPKAKETISKAIRRGVRIACGTDAPAIPHGRNAKELLALVDRGMTPGKPSGRRRPWPPS